MNWDNDEVSGFINGSSEVLSKKILDLQFHRNRGLKERYSERDKELCLQDIGYHLKYLSAAVKADSPELFRNYMAWVKALMGGLGIPHQVIAENLICIRDVLVSEVGEEALEILDPYIGWGVENYMSLEDEIPTFMEGEGELDQLASRYLELVLSGNRKLASDLILDLAEGGMDIKDIYLGIFQRTQSEMGRLWQKNRVTVAQEHFVTATTQMIMSLLYPHLFTVKEKGKKMLATCVSGELHEIGIRMVSDIFEMEGWDTYYLGANTPQESVISTLKEQRPDLLAVSATILTHMEKVRNLIKEVRAQPELKEMKILVGGHPFNIDTELWRFVGSDGYAQDAVSALNVADDLIGVE